MSGWAAPKRDYVSGIKSPVCKHCGSRRMILHRIDKQDRTSSYFLRCSDCETHTSSVPTLKQVCELAEWVPIGAVEVI